MEDLPTVDQSSANQSSEPLPQLPFFQRIPPVPFAIISLCIVFFLYQGVGGIIALVMIQGMVTEENVILVRWSTLVGQLLLILVPTLVLARLRHLEFVNYFRLKLPDYKEILATVVAVFALQQILQGYMMFQDSFPLPHELRNIVDKLRELLEQTYKLLVVAHSPLEFVFVVLIVALTPAVCEELLFRGLVQRSFESTVGGLRAAVIAGIIFGAYHLNPFSFVPLVVLGIYFGFIVHRSHNITVAISAHFVNNFIACAAVYLQLDDDYVAVAPMGEVTPFLLVANYAVFGVVFLLATYYFLSVTKSVTRTDE